MCGHPAAFRVVRVSFLVVRRSCEVRLSPDMSGHDRAEEEMAYSTVPAKPMRRGMMTLWARLVSLAWMVG